MSKICEICGKGKLRGNLVPRLIGRRVSRRTIRYQFPNLRVKRIDLGNGRRVRVKICTDCLSKLTKTNKSEA